jgi:hypothetical protein
MKDRIKSGDYNWMKKCDGKVSKGTNHAMKETQKLIMKIAGAK